MPEPYPSGHPAVWAGRVRHPHRCPICRKMERSMWRSKRQRSRSAKQSGRKEMETHDLGRGKSINRLASRHAHMGAHCRQCKAAVRVRGEEGSRIRSTIGVHCCSRSVGSRVRQVPGPWVVVGRETNVQCKFTRHVKLRVGRWWVCRHPILLRARNL